MGKIVVVGSSNNDLVVNVGRAPSAGETVFGQSFMVNPGGKGANQAVAVARIGGSVSFVTKVGDDLFGKQMKQHFLDEGIDLSHVLTDSNAPTGTALITVEDSGENRIIVVSGANASLRVSDIDDAVGLIDECDIVLVQLEIPLPTVEHVAELAASRGKRLILNPAPACALSDKLLGCVSLITPNETEAEILTGIKVTDESSASRAVDFFLGKGVQQVVITLGSSGAFVGTRDVRTLVPAYKVNAVDTTAAGDVFNGALAVSLSEGRSLLEAVRFATAASAIAVTRRGAQSSVPVRSEVDDLLSK